MLRFCLVSAILALSIGAIVWSDTPRLASAKCPWPGPNRSNLQQTYHDGWDRHPGADVGGTYARIRNQSPWVEPGTNFNGERRFSAAYSMLKRARGEGFWAQIGWVEYAYSERYTFIQQKNGPGLIPITQFFAAEPVNALTYYTTVYQSTPTRVFSYYVNGVQKGNSISTNWTPIGAEVMGEINIYSNQMPGGYSW